VTRYHGTLVWQWMRLPGDVVFAVGALLMAWDFIIKIGPPLSERCPAPAASVSAALRAAGRVMACNYSSRPALSAAIGKRVRC
jgi:hypothetical protein